MSSILKTYPALTLYRVIVIYTTLMLCRVVFTLYNAELFGAIEWEEVPRLIYGGLRFDTISLCYAFGVWILFSLLPLHIREKKWYKESLFWYYAVVITICIAINLADAIYFRYTQKRFTAEEFFFTENSNSLQLLLKFAAENLHLVAVGVLLIAAAIWAYRRKADVKAVLSGWSYYIAGTAVLLLTILLCVAGIRGGLSRMARPTAIPYSLKFAKDGNKANIVLSNPFCIIRTAGSSKLEVPKYFSQSELHQIYTPYHLPDGNREFSAKNVVIFVCESMSAEHSKYLCPDLYSDDEAGYTPFLDSLMQNGYTFKRMYANGKRSIQALPSVWGSIPSLEEPFVLMPQSLGQSRPLPQLLREKGYSTAFFCGSERGSMGFDAYAISAGFEKCLSKEDYEKVYGKDDFDGYWGIWDDKFLKYMGEQIDTMAEPFLASVFTISSHHPFVVPEHLKSSLPKGNTPMQPCAAYLDGAIREFFEANRSKEWFSRTIFAFVADHVSCEQYAERTKTSPGDFHVLGLLYAGDNSLRGSYQAPVSQIDIMPTLLGLLGYEREYFAYGRDIFNAEAMPVIVFDNGAYKAFTDSHIHIFTDGRVTEVYSIEDIARSENLIATHYDSSIEQLIKAYIQQYYEHAERKSYIVPDTISCCNRAR